MFNASIYKIVLSKPAKGGEFRRGEVVRSGLKYQASMYTQTQVFHSNFDFSGLKEFLDVHIGASFLQYTAWDGEYEYSARVSKKGKILTTRSRTAVQPRREEFGEGFNRQKNHILREGEDIPVLVDMGVFTRSLKVAAPMWDKFHQINRFLELLADETGEDSIAPNTTVNIIDFGCGKSYLTFLVYHYFTKIRGLSVSICGLDLNADVVEKCSIAAEKYGYESLSFKQGDIGEQDLPPLENWGALGTFNIVISLHACDTATDYALYNAIKWEADLICAVPCCQHELRGQMNPATLKLFSEYGIIKERVASLMTDAIRAKVLEHCGYKSQIIEFIAMEHTSKNLLIRAKRIAPKCVTGEYAPEMCNKNICADDMKDILVMSKEFSISPKIISLLEIGKNFRKALA